MYDLVSTHPGPDELARNFNAFTTQATEPDELMVVDFWAPWCGPCKTLLSTLTPYADSLAGTKVAVGKVNVEEEMELASQFNVRSLPTVLFFRNGEVVHELRRGVTTGAVQQLVASLTSDQEDEF